MKTKHAVLIFMILATLFLSACQSLKKTATDEKKTSSEISKQDLGNLKLTKLDGTTTDMNALLAQSELTVVHIWDPTCDDCPDEMKVLDEVGTQYLGRGIQVVGIVKGVYDKGNQDTLDALKKTGVNYVQLLDSEELEKKLSGTYPDTPFTILLGRDGEQLGETYTEVKDKEFWDKELDKYHKQVCVGDHPADCAVG